MEELELFSARLPMDGSEGLCRVQFPTATGGDSGAAQDLPLGPISNLHQQLEKLPIGCADLQLYL